MSWKRARERIREREKRLVESPLVFDLTPDPAEFAWQVAEHLGLLMEEPSEVFH